MLPVLQLLLQWHAHDRRRHGQEEARGGCSSYDTCSTCNTCSSSLGYKRPTACSQEGSCVR